MTSHWCTILLTCILTGGVSLAAAPARPNVLFVMADDLRQEWPDQGSPALIPNLQALAKRGVRFDRAYCQQALCNPSRSSLLTGKRPDTLRLWHNSTHFRELNPEVVTLPQWFLQHGYTTRCVGKIFHNWHTQEKGDRRSWSAPEFLHYANHGDDKPIVSGAAPPNLAQAPRCERRDVPDEAYYDGRVAAEAVRVLREIKDQPFFLAVGFWKPHAPFNAPKKYWDLYDRAKLPKWNPDRPQGTPELAFHDGRELRGLPPNQLTFTHDQAAEIRHGYLANLSYMDAQLGKVLQTLHELGLDDKTIIVFLGDHGYHLGEHGLWAKTSNFELDARVPLIVATPDRQSAGKPSTALVEALDLFPTLVDLCGLPGPTGLEGRSLAPLLTNPATAIKAAAFTQHPRPAYFDRESTSTPQAMGVSIRTATVRYTEWRDWTTGRTLARELYDAQADPGETHNRVDDPQLQDAQRLASTWLSQQFPTTPHR